MGKNKNSETDPINPETGTDEQPTIEKKDSLLTDKQLEDIKNLGERADIIKPKEKKDPSSSAERVANILNSLDKIKSITSTGNEKVLQNLAKGSTPLDEQAITAVEETMEASNIEVDNLIQAKKEELAQATSKAVDDGFKDIVDKMTETDVEKEERMQKFFDFYVKTLEGYREMVEGSQDTKNLKKFINSIDECQANMSEDFFEKFGTEMILSDNRGNEIWNNFESLKETITSKIEELEKDKKTELTEEERKETINKIAGDYVTVIIDKEKDFKDLLEKIETNPSENNLNGLVELEEVTRASFDEFFEAVINTKLNDKEDLAYFDEISNENPALQAIRDRFKNLMGEINKKVEELGEKPELNEDEQKVAEITDKYEPIATDMEAAFEEFLQKNEKSTRDNDLSNLHKLIYDSYTEFFGKVEKYINKDGNDIYRKVPKFEVTQRRFLELLSKISYLKPDEEKPKDEQKGKEDEPKDSEKKKEKQEGDIYKGFEREQEVVARNKGVLESGWKIVDLKEGTQNLFSEPTLKEVRERTLAKGLPFGDAEEENWKKHTEERKVAEETRLAEKAKDAGMTMEEIKEIEKKENKIGIAVIKKGDVERNISIDTLHELNKSWKETYISKEVGGAVGKGAVSIAMSLAGIKFVPNIVRHFKEKKELSKLPEVIKNLSKFTAKSTKDGRDRGKSKEGLEGKDLKENTMELQGNFEKLDNILEKAKEGTEKNSAARKKIAQLLQLTRKGELRETQKQDEIEKITKVYLSQKTSGMQVIREEVNSLLTVASYISLLAPNIDPAIKAGVSKGILAGRAAMMPFFGIAEKMSEIKKTKQRAGESDLLEKSVFNTKTEDIKKTTKEIKEIKGDNFGKVVADMVTETCQKLLFKGENKTKLQKGLGGGGAWANIARYTGYILQAKYGMAFSIPGLFRHFAEHPELGASGETITPDQIHSLAKDHGYKDTLEKLLHKIPFVPAEKTPQEQLTETFPGLESQKGELLTNTTPHQTGAAYVESTKQKSINFDIIGKENKLHPVKIPFTDSSKTATETINEYLQKHDIDPDQITNAQVKEDLINKAIPATIIRETYDDASSLDNDPVIQNKVGNTVAGFDHVLENKDLVHAGNEIVITAKDGRTFKLAIKEGSNNWNTLEQFYHNNPNTKPEDIDSIDVVRGTSAFEPDDLPHHIPGHETGHVAHSDEITNSENDAKDFDLKKSSYIPTPDEEIPQSAEKNLENQNEKINPGSVHPDISESIYPKDSKFNPDVLDSNLKGTPQEAINTDFIETNREATKMYNEVSSSLYRGNREVEGKIIDHLDEIDALKGGGIWNANSKEIAEHAEEIKKIAYNDLLPKEYKDRTSTGILASFKKNNNIEKALDAWVNNPKNRTSFDKIHDIAQRINSSNGEGNEGITHLDKLLDVLRSKEK